MISILIFIIVLGVLVFIHELGHFVSAKLNGVMVEEFGLGFPPRVWSFKKGDTVYSINAIPIGGFVKVYGEEYHEVDKIDHKIKDKAFFSKKSWQKFIILSAGVFMNLVLAVLIYYSLIFSNGFKSEPLPLINDHDFAFGEQQKRILITGISEDGSASNSDIKFGDIVYKVQKAEEVSSQAWIDVTSAEQLINFVNNSSGEKIWLELKNVQNNEEKVVSVVPQFSKELGRSVIGVGLMDAVVVSYSSNTQKLFAGFMHSYNIISYNFSTLGKLFGIAFQERDISPVSQSVAGPVGIFTLVGEITKSSGGKLLRNILDFTATLSLSLAIMNILPIPALDGGRIVLVFYEWLLKKPINTYIERRLNLGGFIFLISLIILITLNDVLRLVNK